MMILTSTSRLRVGCSSTVKRMSQYKNAHGIQTDHADVLSRWLGRELRRWNGCKSDGDQL